MKQPDSLIHGASTPPRATEQRMSDPHRDILIGIGLARISLGRFLCGCTYDGRVVIPQDKIALPTNKRDRKARLEDLDRAQDYLNKAETTISAIPNAMTDDWLRKIALVVHQVEGYLESIEYPANPTEPKSFEKLFVLVRKAYFTFLADISDAELKAEVLYIHSNAFSNEPDDVSSQPLGDEPTAETTIVDHVPPASLDRMVLLHFWTQRRLSEINALSPKTIKDEFQLNDDQWGNILKNLRKLRLLERTGKSKKESMYFLNTLGEEVAAYINEAWEPPLVQKT